MSTYIKLGQFIEFCIHVGKHLRNIVKILQTFCTEKYNRQVTTSNQMEKKFVLAYLKAKRWKSLFNFSQEAYNFVIVSTKCNRWLSQWFREKLERLAYNVVCFPFYVCSNWNQRTLCRASSNQSKLFQNFKRLL